ncbi:FAD binding domain-containing protein [Romboutsia sedimentorum]|uniref:FAD binding domain-containing protein n=1 Tax=Romboutsia sedimentorum TaxID=1368474 RepID=A0ABT7EAS0_9FIRM|nr:FAD binding domain-containing protein [Romboutsia sedimentorum]MDK2564024.1 FAD binding domain-containing protein [Romboutsia sedimentorum]
MVKEVFKVKSLESALYILEVNKYRAKVIAGGTDLVVDMKNDKFDKEILIDISDVKQLKFIEDEGDIMKIGGCTTLNEIIKSPKINSNLQGLKKACSLVGSPQIRSRATIGGNICNASPSSDLIPPLLALDAKVCIQSKNSERKEYLKDILLDKNKIKLNEDEILKYIEFKNLNPNQVLSFVKLGFRKSLSISKISCSVLLEIEENKFKNMNIALGALSKIAMREYEVEQYLKGKSINQNTINKALDIVQESISERLKNRASVEFKSNAVKGVLKQAIYEGISLYNIN